MYQSIYHLLHEAWHKYMHSCCRILWVRTILFIRGLLNYSLVPPGIYWCLCVLVWAPSLDSPFPCEVILDGEDFVLACPHSEPSQFILGSVVEMVCLKAVNDTFYVLQSKKKKKTVCGCVFINCMFAYARVWRKRIYIFFTFLPQWERF